MCVLQIWAACAAKKDFRPREVWTRGKKSALVGRWEMMFKRSSGGMVRRVGWVGVGGGR